ncbi:MAG TPA: redoxin domain-containing protein [Thermomicrobiales bacterium]|nr:redoxin domain-containing protein [Thermomicrobiales bacterium]
MQNPQSTIRNPHLRAPLLPASAGPWFNGGPVAGWRGATTLVEFWTYSCVNCLRTLPALREWHARYGSAGLTVLGVHTPEFPFERDPANVAQALRDLGVTFPVVLDNDRAIWSRFANRFWPQRYLIDREGRIRYERAGEGGEAATEQAIRDLLGEGQPDLPSPSPYLTLADDTSIGAVCAPATPELFAGYYRGVSGNPGGFQEDTVARYTDPGGYREGYIHLQGRWRVDADAATFAGPEPGWLRVAWRGLAVNAVLAPAANTTGALQVRLGPLAAPRDQARAHDLTIVAPRLYELGAAHPDASGLTMLTLVPATSGLAVYSFTFARCGAGSAECGVPTPASS